MSKSKKEEALSKIDDELEAVEKEKAEIAGLEGRSTTYIKAKVFENHKTWWKAISHDLESKDFKIRKSAMIEFNKLQCRVLPTELGQAADSDGIVLKVISYQINNDKKEDK